MTTMKVRVAIRRWYFNGGFQYAQAQYCTERDWIWRPVTDWRGSYRATTYYDKQHHRADILNCVKELVQKRFRRRVWTSKVDVEIVAVEVDRSTEARGDGR